MGHSELKTQLVFGWVVDTARVHQWLDNNNLTLDTGQVYSMDAGTNSWVRNRTLLPRYVYLVPLAGDSDPNKCTYAVSLINRAKYSRLSLLRRKPLAKAAAFAATLSAEPLGEPRLFAWPQ
jgi:hypothetical protein